MGTVLATAIGRGTTAAKPAAAAANEGYLYYDTDLDKLQRSNGSTWQDVERTDAASITETYSAWTPALTASAGNPTLGSGSSTQGRYFQNGKHVVGYGSIIFGSSGVAAGSGDYQISLPATARTSTNSDMNMMGQGYLFDSSASALRPCIFVYVSTTIVKIRLTSDGSVVKDNAPWVWSTGDALIFHFDYEAA
jgi:hypothetical protein